MIGFCRSRQGRVPEAVTCFVVTAASLMLSLAGCDLFKPSPTRFPTESEVQTRVAATLTAVAASTEAARGPTATPTRTSPPQPSCTATALPSATSPPPPSATSTSSPTAIFLPTSTETLPPAILSTPATSPTVTAPPPPSPTATMPPSPTMSPTAHVNEWRGEYYANTDLAGNPVLVRNDVEIDFDWGTGSPAAGLPADSFSVRWTRSLFFEGASYRFSVLVDDGTRLWVDDMLLIDAWYDGGARTVTGLVALARGWHRLRLEYYERGDAAVIRLWWQAIKSFSDWRGAYWSNPNLEGNPVIVRNDPEINFSWGAGRPAPGLPVDGFSVRWTRKVQFDAAPYRFYAVVDDGLRLWVDDDLILDAWQDGGVRTLTIDRPLVRGPHDIKVEYYERTGEATARVWWEKSESFPNWRGEYWWTRDLSGAPALVRNDPALDFDWGAGAPASGLPADNFSARWTRSFYFREGTHVFYALADDVIRVWVDDVLLIDAWQGYSPDEMVAERWLGEGLHSLRVEYAEYGGDARVRLLWERAEEYPDWKGAYWANQDLSGNPIFIRNDPVLDFDWGEESPAPGMPHDDFSARWTRRVYFEAGNYRFRALADDVVQLWINGVLLLDSWTGCVPHEMVADRWLSEGMHSLRVDYAEYGGKARIRVQWERYENYPDWKGEYYPNRDLFGPPAYVRNDSRIEFDWGQGVPAPGLPEDDFSVRWSRQVIFESGRYRFRARADDGIRVYLDGMLLLDEWHESSGNVEYTFEAVLSGTHTVTVEYYDHAFEARVAFWGERIGNPSTQSLLFTVISVR